MKNIIKNCIIIIKKSKNKRRKNAQNNKGSIINKVKKNMSAAEGREFQIKSLLNWKNYPQEESIANNDNERQYYEFDDLVNVNYEKYCKDLQCILINPPWSTKSQKFDFSTFVFIYFNNNLIYNLE